MSSSFFLDKWICATVSKRVRAVTVAATRLGAWLIFNLWLCPLGLFSQTLYYQANPLHANAGSVIVSAHQKDLDSGQLAVYLQSEWKMHGNKGQAMLGKKVIHDQQLIFTPLLPFRPFQAYVAVYAESPPLFFSIDPQEDFPVTTIAGIYPSPDTLPANLLKIYLHFSAPMSIGNVYQYLNLHDEKGKTRVQPFLELQPELWDKKQQKLTLWLDPGRIKRDLQPNQELGPPLEEGKYYTLEIAKTWKDAKGIPLGKNYQKTFYISEADRQKPNIATWEINTPEKATKQPLLIKTITSLDQGTASHPPKLLLKEKMIPGNWELQPGEKGWTFHPLNTWQPGIYNIQFDERLEDLAGNNLSRLFDQEIFNQPGSNSPKIQKHQQYDRSFQIE